MDDELDPLSARRLADWLHELDAVAEPTTRAAWNELKAAARRDDPRHDAAGLAAAVTTAFPDPGVVVTLPGVEAVMFELAQAVADQWRRGTFADLEHVEHRVVATCGALAVDVLRAALSLAVALEDVDDVDGSLASWVGPYLTVRESEPDVGVDVFLATVCEHLGVPLEDAVIAAASLMAFLETPSSGPH